MQRPLKLCPDRLTVLNLELGLGNAIDYIAEPAGTTCPYSVSLKQPLNLAAIQERGLMPPWVKVWTSTDPHYAIETGLVCERTRHCLAGPIR